ncbi:hypothetical protein AAEU32_08575 [Pseudoalteromonas sp. SSDWG2]|uniref:hypothetical protein n=1 Tax=Pseudoalteromonas sp. SSDWG2 TaxID=3139391 RepID=UPI003BAD1820
MENNRFFKLVWRVNGLIILGSSLIIFAFILFQLISDALRPSYNTPPPTVENLADDPLGKEKWVIGNPMYLEGSDYVLLPLVSENKEVEEFKRGSFGSSSMNMFGGGYYSDPSKNILFLNTKDNTSFWLFKGVNRLIQDITLLPRDYESDAPTQAIFYQVIVKDTNKDNKLSKEDASSLFISEPNGDNYQLVLEAYDRIVSRALVDENRLIIIYQYQGKAHSKLIQLSPFKEISNVELPKVE